MLSVSLCPVKCVNENAYHDAWADANPSHPTVRGSPALSCHNYYSSSKQRTPVPPKLIGRFLKWEIGEKVFLKLYKGNRMEVFSASTVVESYTNGCATSW